MSPGGLGGGEEGLGELHFISGSSKGGLLQIMSRFIGGGCLKLLEWCFIIFVRKGSWN